MNGGGFMWLPADTGQAAIAYTAIGTPRSAVSVDPVAEARIQLRLWPNPVLGMPTFQFALPENGIADIGIYDLCGRRVWQEHLTGSPREVITLRPGGRGEWTQPAGVYWLQYEIGSEVGTRRFVVLGARE